ncbi:MAG: sigma 54-interacting transcriptional regulator, partial [Myxococcales bacterium]|nr:sigma 54-interacting transcriptional regulator [Myxococcales bacterium]
VMATDTTVLVTGETGTGKELVAQALHNNGPRRERLFAAVNCGALTETLLESELFGHVRGAFTGAIGEKKGLFAIADRGTLFLDEIGEISPAVQVRLLRAIQEGEITPVGATRPVRVNVRLICATNRRLEEEVSSGRFRQDLYYRINVFPIELPPLRERRGDVTRLAEHFLRGAAKKFGKTIRGFTPNALDCLEAYRFPGNVRELENEIERAALFAPDGGTIDTSHLSDRVQGGIAVPSRPGKLKETMEALEKQVIVRALEQHDGNRSRTAVTLGISRQALQVKLARYGMVATRDD